MADFAGKQTDRQTALWSRSTRITASEIARTSTDQPPTPLSRPPARSCDAKRLWRCGVLAPRRTAACQTLDSRFRWTFSISTNVEEIASLKGARPRRGHRTFAHNPNPGRAAKGSRRSEGKLFQEREQEQWSARSPRQPRNEQKEQEDEP